MHPVLLRTEINTELVDDCFIIPIRDQNASFEWLLSEVSRRYHEWHPFKVYEFEINRSGCDNDTNIFDVLNATHIKNSKQLSLKIVESEKSKLLRREDEEKEEQLRLERLRIEQEKREKRRKRIAEIERRGNCWELVDYSQFLNVPLYNNNDDDKEDGAADDDDDDADGGRIVENTGSLDQWCSIRFVTAVLPSFNQFFFSLRIVTLPATTNTWKVCVGAVPIEFNIKADRHWVGAQHSWSYIGGTGGKCYNSGKSVSYGESYKDKDVVSVLLNFESGNIEFFKNGKSQGVAFQNLKHAVIPAVSFTAKGCQLEILDLLEDKYMPAKLRPFMLKNVEIIRNDIKQRQFYLSDSFEAEQNELWHKHGVNSLYPRFSSHHNPPSLAFSSSSNNKAKNQEQLQQPPDAQVCNIVVNNGSGDKWRISRSFGGYYPQAAAAAAEQDLVAFEFVILSDGKSSNTWRICLGVVPVDFDGAVDKIWVGAQHSWSYIAGTGGKCFNSAQSNSYGERYTANDRISVLIDFKQLSIEFFKNNESQGIAFDNCEALKAGVCAAVSMTAADARIKFSSLSRQIALNLKQIGITHRQILHEIVSKYGNIWDGNKKTSNKHNQRMFNVVDTLCVENTGVAAPGSDSKNNKNASVWNTIGSLLPYQTGRRYFEIVLVDLSDAPLNASQKLLKSNNAVHTKWKICVGVVSKSFNFNHSKNKHFVGGPSSWALILGNGQKCHNSTKSATYTSESFAKNDRIGVLMDFDNASLEFFKNDKPMGEAFNNLCGPVYAAVSVACNYRCVLKFDPSAEDTKTEHLFLFK